MEKGKLIIPKSKKFQYNEKIYTLKKSIESDFLNWEGAFAGFYIEHPLTNQIINIGVNYTCPLGFFKEFLRDLIKEYYELNSFSETEIKEKGLENKLIKFRELFE